VRIFIVAAGLRSLLKTGGMRNNRLVAATNRPAAGAGQIDWVQAYEKRMRRFNLEVILGALIALVIVIVSLIFSW
jgi:hypothetical protein